jgi:hypothetical protein
MSGKTVSSILLAATVLLVILAAVTLVPFSNPMVSDLGYHTLCPFAPWSTLTLLFIGGLAWVLRGYIKAQPAG